MNVGFIGLGSMGSRIANLLLDGGHHVTVWARRSASVEPFAGRVEVAASPKEVARVSDVVGVCVWGEQDVTEVLLRSDGVLAGLRPGGVVCVHSTISPTACRELGRAVTTRGGDLLDAPVSVGAHLPKLLTMVGGDEAAFERCRPVLEAIGNPVLHLGPLGGGQLAKLVNNTMLAATIGLGDDAIAFGESLGLDTSALRAVLTFGSSGGTWSHLMNATAEAPAVRGATEWARKDVGFAVSLATEAGLDLSRDLLRLAGRGVEVLG